MADRTRLGVLGWSVGHSRSPAMQNAGLRAAGLEGWRYQLLPVPPHIFSETVLALPALGFRGVNVTIPHKQAALALAGDATARASAIGAANTLVFDDYGTVFADNTDAPALIEALGARVSGATVLVLGAGGSARAAVWALLDAGAADVQVWNRNPERARELCEAVGGRVSADAGGAADVLVNCTSVGLSGIDAGLKDLPVAADDLGRYGFVVDYVYRDGGTPLVNAASALGIGFVDGLQLLLGQGALSFEQFTGAIVPVEAMRTALEIND
jgi:shikimate dehydrogenase